MHNLSPILSTAANGSGNAVADATRFDDRFGYCGYDCDKVKHQMEATALWNYYINNILKPMAAQYERARSNRTLDLCDNAS